MAKIEEISKSQIKLIAYCGLYCSKCYKMKVSEAAEKLIFELGLAQKRGAKYLQEDPLLKEKIVASSVFFVEAGNSELDSVKSQGGNEKINLW